MELLDLEESLITKIPIHRDRIKEAFDYMDEDLKMTMREFVKAHLRLGNSIDYLASCYDFFLRETFREQASLWLHKEYSDYGREGIQAVYKNDDYMEKFVIGLGLSTFLWKQHRQQFSFFNNFIKNMVTDQGAKYLEIGAGQGLLTSRMIREKKFLSYDLIDISAKALEITRSILDGFADKMTMNYICKDFLRFDEDNFYDFIMANEVLPNFEEPYLMLKKCQKLMSGGIKKGIAYISTPINAPIMNGISPFHSVNEIEELFANTKLNIVDKVLIPLENYTIEECKQMNLPINVSYILMPQ